MAASIAIVGAGFSGTALALGLRAQAPSDVTIQLVDRSGRFGPGLAYHPTSAAHLLNVPAARMSAFADQPDDFLDWLRAQLGSAETAPGAFASRAAYGAYLAERLRAGIAARDGARLQIRGGQAVALAHSDHRYELTLATGGVLTADVVVLALGNESPVPPPELGLLVDTPVWGGDAWSPAALQGLAADAPVLLVGTSLTMVDVVISLLDAGHRGPIHAISRRGLLPRAHRAVPAPAMSLPTPLPPRVGAVMRVLRAEVAAGHPWHAVVDALRPHTQRLWAAMDAAEQARFLRHARAWWDVHRHRMAPEVAARIEAAQASGQLRVQAGRIVAASPAGEAATVTWQPRGAAEPERLTIARVVACTGPGSDVRRSSNPLLLDVLRQGLARPDPLAIGLDVTDTLEVRGAAGDVSEGLFAIGPLTKGRWWEITSVPDIRVQAATLAAHLAARAAQVGGSAVAPRGSELAVAPRGSELADAPGAARVSQAGTWRAVG